MPKASKAFTAAAPTTSPTLVLAANLGRWSATISNNGSVTVYLGKDNTVSTATGFALDPGMAVEDEESTDAWWGITASGTGDLRIEEAS